MTKPRVIIESPYAGNVERNTRYARACLRDSLMRGEAPLASHVLYAMSGVLDDTDPIQRALGIEAGQAWIPVADRFVVYRDIGTSDGMHMGIDCAENAGFKPILRTLEGWT